MEDYVIFIAGVHGVGKSTMCKKISKKLNISSYSASDLIKKAKRTFYHDKKVNISEMENNQKLLINELKKIQKNKEVILLDGHFVLFDKSNGIIKIPFENYLQLNLLAIIVLIGEAEKICQNLRKRDNIDYNIDTIIEMQNHEIEYARWVSNQLNINIFIIDINDNDKIINTIKSIMY